MNNLNDYQKLALRTMADQRKILLRNSGKEAGILLPESVSDRMVKGAEILTQLDNAARGMAGDVGEVNTCVQKCLEYGKPLDLVNLKEELGDVLWRIVQACDAVGFTLQEVADANIAKLAKRYPDKYTDTLAHEENRDREAERDAIVKANASPTMEFVNGIVEQTGHGFAEPPEEKEEPDVVRRSQYQVNVEKLVPDPFSDTLEPALTPSYDRYCLVCNMAKVHKTNSLQVCGDCYPRHLKMKEEGSWGGFLANR